MYFNGPFAATVAYQQVKFDSQPDDLAGMTGFRSQQAVQLGATYDLYVVKLFGQYQYIRNNIAGGGVSENGGQLGVSVPLGNGSVLASYAYTKSSGASNVNRKTWALGYDYPLSKRTDVYAAYMNDKVSTLGWRYLRRRRSHEVLTFPRTRTLCARRRNHRRGRRRLGASAPSFVRSIAMSLFADVDADTDTPGRSHARVSVVSQSGFMCHRIHGSAL